jgi:hypothetical protein
MEMSERFTKGNWHTEQRAKGVIILADSEDLNAGFSICSVNGPESEANAALIECAPEMYEMLVEVNKYLDSSKIDWLLAKARGEL